VRNSLFALPNSLRELGKSGEEIGALERETTRNRSVSLTIQGVAGRREKSLRKPGLAKGLLPCPLGQANGETALPDQKIATARQLAGVGGLFWSVYMLNSAL